MFFGDEYSDGLPISPTHTFGYDHNGLEGAEVLVAFSGEAKAMYIDGEKVYDYDDLPLSRVMRILSEKTDGNLAAFAEREAAYNKRNGERLYNEELPEDPSDIVFSEELETVNIQDAEDLREKLQPTSSRYVVVNIRAGIVDEEMVREYASDDFARKIIDVV